jgi:hypothetical protein
MANITLAQANADLLTVNAAISEIYAGTRRKQVRLGTHDYNRTIENADPIELLKLLLAEKQRLQTYINSLDSTAPVFRGNANIPIIVGRS